jgi:methylenetetrahydrofolate reductase (NADPH)
MNKLPIAERLTRPEPILSVEFFPPKSDAAAESLLKSAEDLKVLPIDFVSITYGAGGSTRSRTLKYARQLSEEFGYEVMPHLTCVGHSKAQLLEIIAEFKSAGLSKIMALRGDPPKGETDFKPHPDGLSHANELVHLIQEVYPECAIGVAGYPEKHPEAPSPEIDLLNLKQKVNAGATFITTQLFYDNGHYYRFVENCQNGGIKVPVLPGLMSVTSRQQAIRFCEMCGTAIPKELDDELIAAGDSAEAVEKIGFEWTYRQAKDLLEKHAPGLHLYILNKSGPAIELVHRLQSDGYFKS